MRKLGRGKRSEISTAHEIAWLLVMQRRMIRKQRSARCWLMLDKAT